ncbi:MAG: Endonuclease V [Thermotogales bacterium 46_20]|nr:MAG: Endonuclease V [Thermotogales bacterium 46_20]
MLQASSLGIVECVVEKGPVHLPYVPGYLSFREGPLFIRTLACLKSEPDLFFFDGQGIAHPRRLGLAAHLGVLLGIPSIGVAKSRLVGKHNEPDQTRGSWTYLIDNGERLGAVLRTRDKVKPVFVSPGHLIDIESAVELTMSVTGKYRIPEPTRLAHINSRRAQTS